MENSREIEAERRTEKEDPPPEIIPAFQSRTVRLLTLLFVVSIIFAFWLISYDEMIRAFIGILIINGWFFAILILHLQGKILFLDDIESDEEGEKELPRSPRPQESKED